MRIKFYGSCGSIPSPLGNDLLYEKIRKTVLQALEDRPDPERIDDYLAGLPFQYTSTFRGNSSCILVDTMPTSDGKNHIIAVDAGSGFRLLGFDLLRNNVDLANSIIHVFLSHIHWDHIQGIPFFVPSFFSTTHIKFYSLHDDFKQLLSNQQIFEYFPITMEQTPAQKQFIQLQLGEPVSIGEISVSTIPLNHPNKAYGYRIDHNSHAVVYASDNEMKAQGKQAKNMIKFAHGADMLVFDTQFPFEKAITKFKDWGHSSPITGVEISIEAAVKRMILFHHDPYSTDEQILELVNRSKKWAAYYRKEAQLEIMAAYDGLEFRF